MRNHVALKAAYWSVATAAFLILIKLVAWWLTGSVAMMASLVDSAADVVSSLVILFSLNYALKPADAEHRFGHGKAEGLAALAQSAFMCGSAMFLALQAMERFWSPQPLAMVNVGVAVIAISIVATTLLVFIQRRAIAASGSLAIKADSLHYVADLLSNFAVLVALVGSYFGWQMLDALIAIGIAFYLIYNAVSILKESINMLLDRELPMEHQEKILAIVRANPRVVGVHDLRTRQSGQFKFIQLHLNIDGKLPLLEAHAISDTVDAAIREAFPDADVIIHQDPV